MVSLLQGQVGGLGGARPKRKDASVGRSLASGLRNFFFTYSCYVAQADLKSEILLPQPHHVLELTKEVHLHTWF